MFNFYTFDCNSLDKAQSVMSSLVIHDKIERYFSCFCPYFLAFKDKIDTNLIKVELYSSLEEEQVCKLVDKLGSKNFKKSETVLNYKEIVEYANVISKKMETQDKKYKLRAEFPFDFTRFSDRNRFLTNNSDYILVTHCGGHFEFSCRLELDIIRSSLAKVEDGHVMYESLNYENKFTGDRYFTLVK